MRKFTRWGRESPRPCSCRVLATNDVCSTRAIRHEAARGPAPLAEGGEEAVMRLRASVTGLLTGIAAGFVGVGGGEFRIPVLVRVLGLSLYTAAGVNLLVGACTVALSAYRRLGQRGISEDAVTLTAVMGVASIAGAIIGVTRRHHLRARPLTTVVRIYLIVVGGWMLYEALIGVERVLLSPVGITRWAMAGGFAFVIAAISGVLGVAGGEMRIPVLLYLCAIPIVEAGTLSLLVSIPTVVAGAITDRRIGGIPNTVLPAAAWMGLASAVGVLLGVALIPYASQEAIKGALGAILIGSAIRLTPHAVPLGLSKAELR